MTNRPLLFVSTLAFAAVPLFVQSPAMAQATAATSQFVTSQPAGEMLGRLFLGAVVKNATGETVGDVNDVMFDRTGRISTVVLGVGGFLGMGEKNVGVPFSGVSFNTDKDGARVILVTLSKEALKAAPDFKATEKSTYEVVKEKAVELGTKASEKAVEFKDQAIKKVDDMKK